MNGLVLEGGTFRPIFSAGVMDALLDEGVEFDYVIGISAGITNGISYVSKQKRRNLNVLVNLRHDKRYVGFRNYISDKSLFGIKFAYEEMPVKLYPFDWDTYNNSKMKVRVGVTNAKTGKAEYLDGKKMRGNFDMLKATCALPLIFPVIKIGKKEYYDGGITDSIPAKKALEEGCDKLLIVLTRPKGYRKKLSRSNVMAARVLKKTYPKLSEAILNRPKMYNAQIEYCEELERQGKAVIFRPSRVYQIESFEKDIDKIKMIYNHGYRMAKKRIKEIKGLFE